MSEILIIDDDTELCELLADYLRSEEFTVRLAHHGGLGLEDALSDPPDLVVLDVMLPGMSGFEVLRAIRSQSTLPVLMLTARGEEIDRIVGLEMGADDYLPKPFNPRELLARIRAIRRRSVPPPPGQQGMATRLAVGDLVLDADTRTVFQKGCAVELTSVEFSLLQELLRAAGAVVSRETLAEQVLGRKLSSFDRSVDVHVSSLRKKLGHEVYGLERIKTVRGVGYLYAKVPGREAGQLQGGADAKSVF